MLVSMVRSAMRYFVSGCRPRLNALVALTLGCENRPVFHILSSFINALQASIYAAHE